MMTELLVPAEDRKALRKLSDHTPQVMHKPSPKRTIARIAGYAALIVFAAGLLAPFAWMVLSSLKSANEVFSVPIVWVPEIFVWQNYIDIWSKSNMLVWIRNTLLLAVVVTFLQVLTGSFAAYGFARMKFAGRDILFLVYIGTIAVPWQSYMIPQFILLSNLKVSNTLWAIILLQAFGAFGVFLMKQYYEIIDSLMNMPLLTWAYEQTGDERFADAVRRHTVQLRENILRADDSTFHTFYWDVETGEALRGGTEQGAFDDSCWARGQAWGVYGFAINYRATGDESLLDTAWRCAEYFLAHLPEDGVPYWDLVYPEGSEAPRDSSSAAIAASGFLELARVDPDPVRAERAHAAALDLLTALVSGYTPASAEESNALLLHGVYDMPKDVGVDEGTLWGDYFFLEALSRLENPEWVTYW